MKEELQEKLREAKQQRQQQQKPLLTGRIDLGFLGVHRLVFYETGQGLIGGVVQQSQENEFVVVNQAELHLEDETSEERESEE